MNKKLMISLVVIVLFAGLIWFLQNRAPQEVENEVATNAIVATIAIVGSQTTDTGAYLTDSKGMTLYTFSNDKNLESTCVAECLKNWPIFEFANKDFSSSNNSLTRQLNVVKRADGFYQYAYGPQPLYYYRGDIKPGDKNGDGLNGKWNVVILP